ncbi:hypothetical protein JCM10213_000289 [Rhodosporidiobolus nylandii]
MRKRKAIDLTGDSSDSDAGRSLSTSSSRRRKRVSSPPTSSAAPFKQTPTSELSASQRMAAASSFLAPRSTLFGGSGTGVEKRETRHLDTSPEGLAARGKELKTASPKRKKLAATPDQVLSLGVALEATMTAEEQLEDLEYGDGQLLRTTLPERRVGRPKVKGKGKQREEDSDEDDDEEEKASSPNAAVTFDSIVGDDPEKTVVRALIASPAQQIPWVPNHFATTREVKRREPKINKRPKRDADGNELDKHGKIKKMKKAGPSTSRLFSNKTPLLLLHRDDFSESARNSLEKWSLVSTIKPLVQLKKDKEGQLNARFALLLCNDQHRRRFLRFVVSSAKNEANEWARVENALYIQDFPTADDPGSTAALNPTHTRFSSALYTFLTSPSLSLSSSPIFRSLLEELRHIDFSSSDRLELVTSLAGSWEGKGEIRKGGGFDSLARAMRGLEPREKGKWKVEYLTPYGTLPSNKLLSRLYAACTGVSPLDFISQSTPAAIAAKKALDEAEDGKVALIYPSQRALAAAEDGDKEAKYHVRWEGPDYEDAGKRQKAVLRDCVLKSERVNNATMILILHQPLAKDKVDGDDEQYEAFLYVGSHEPTPSSWGAFSTSNDPATCTISQHDLGILYRCATSSTWKGLLEQVDKVVPYERPLKPYGRRDYPAPTVERPPPKPKQKKGGEESD